MSQHGSKDCKLQLGMIGLLLQKIQNSGQKSDCNTPTIQTKYKVSGSSVYF